MWGWARRSSVNPPNVQNETSQLERWSWREGAGNNMTEEKGRFWVLRSQVRLRVKKEKTLDVCAPSISRKHTNSMERKHETTQNG